jgi:UDP-glucose 4-epimerase
VIGDDEKMKWLITGGAGYIGAHIVRAMIDDGKEVIVLNDESTGNRQKLPTGIDFVHGEICDEKILQSIFEEHDIVGVIHLAAKKSVSESLLNPELYYDVNVEGTRQLLKAAATASIRYFIFSSTAAVYGEPYQTVMTENSPTEPISIYGKSKLLAEEIVLKYAMQCGFKSCSLRYFNVGGAASLHLVRNHAANLLPIILENISNSVSPKIYGDDYSTIDGTCVRDYVHVMDIADSHVALRNKMLKTSVPTEMNIGTGKGTSVREMVDLALNLKKSKLIPEIVPRREGDPAELIAGVALAERILGFRSERTVRQIIESSI